MSVGPPMVQPTGTSTWQHVGTTTDTAAQVGVGMAKGVDDEVPVGVGLGVADGSEDAVAVMLGDTLALGCKLEEAAIWEGLAVAC